MYNHTVSGSTHWKYIQLNHVNIEQNKIWDNAEQLELPLYIYLLPIYCYFVISSHTGSTKQKQCFWNQVHNKVWKKSLWNTTFKEIYEIREYKIWMNTLCWKYLERDPLGELF